LAELAEMALPGEEGVGTRAQQLPHKQVCKKKTNFKTNTGL